jgi:pyrimidine oxygenase
LHLHPVTRNHEETPERLSRNGEARFMELGVFIPIGNNGWLISTTSPQYKPSFDLNREVVEKAERFGFDFALSMIKLHGFGGPSQFWDYKLWEAGRSDFKGDFFQMDDCRCLPLPTAKIPIICAGQSDAGTRFAAQHADYNFCAGGGINQPTAVAPSVARLVEATAEAGRECGALILQMVIADETDEAAVAKWEHYKAGTDLEALAWRDAQAEDDPSKDPYAQPNRRRTFGIDRLPTNQGVFVGSYASVAKMLDEMAAVPGVRGVMLTFDDFVIGMEQFGTRILPLMRCRNDTRRAA